MAHLILLNIDPDPRFDWVRERLGMILIRQRLTDLESLRLYIIHRSYPITVRSLPIYQPSQH